ncbi:MAG: hypothetical protein J6K05_00490 [Bacteroidaceae bacterium]|jgi:hypothetical protein|nr:hypothetical protein [Bacteroidaceae bacterium]
MELGKQTQTAILEALKDALDKLTSASNDITVITDIHLMPSMNSGELCVFDDDDHELSRTFVTEWTNCVPEEFYLEVESQLRSLLRTLDLEKVSLLKPYSFVLVDEEHETVADLLLVDDDTMLLNDGLLKGLDEELDDFLKQLLEE